MITVTRKIENKEYEICNFSTAPFENVEEFLLYRGIGESCKKTGCLRTLHDWEIFYARISSDSDSVTVKMKRKERHIRNSDGTDNLAWKTLTSIIMGYRLGKWNIPYLDREDLSVAEKISWINSFNTTGKEFTISNWKDCRKKSREGQMLSEDVLYELLTAMQNYVV